MSQSWLVSIALLVAFIAISAAGNDQPKKLVVVPLRHAHAHNDYEQKRPLFDALDHGFCSVEADIFLRKGELLVAHTFLDLRAERTLEKLYLDPLRERVKANGGKVFREGPPFYLLIDVKTEADATYVVLDKVLAKYAEMLSVTEDGKFLQRAITVVISGNCARTLITAQKRRYAAIDGRLPDLESTAAKHLIPWISASWGSQFRWRGDGPMPDAEKRKLREIVAKAHQHGRLVRFWATPERVEVWSELRAAKVDLINTDRLAELRKFFADQPRLAP
ncbi:MAG: hypothetical protein FJ303_23685 [Planctomycetes bacterium]|nr:hypothetical protein [Planctomycetota bacterium]